MMKRRPGSRRGFSLIEVVTALGIVTICVLTLMGLLIVGVNSNKTTVNQSIAVNIAGAVAADLRSTPLITQSYTTAETRYSPRFGFVLPAGYAGIGLANGLRLRRGHAAHRRHDDGTSTLTAGTASFRVTIQGPTRQCQRPTPAHGQPRSYFGYLAWKCRPECVDLAERL